VKNVAILARAAHVIMSVLSAWSAIAGGLTMPSAFGHFFAAAQPMSVSSANNDSMVTSDVSAAEDRVVSVAAMPVSDDQSGQPRVIRRCFRRMCLFCRAMHNEHEPCSCFRCGYRHSGDCGTVCSICHRVHAASEFICRIRPAMNFSPQRRSKALFINDADVEDRIPAPRHDLGMMHVECPHCKSRSFSSEKMNCCNGGVVDVAWEDDVPSELSAIILSSHVRQNIRPYNTVMAFASTGHVNKSIIGGTFVLGGRTYHRIGSILPGT
jgi:hypothetical protein